MSLMDTPLYTGTMLDTGIDPREQQGHEQRVQDIIKSHPSRMVKGDQIRVQRRKRTR